MCFLYSLVVASSFLLFPKTDLSKSYQIAKNSIILAVGFLLWSFFTYKFLSSIKSINESVEVLTQLTCKETACQTARLKHSALILIVFLIFLASITLSFIKTYQSIYGELLTAEVTEMIALDIDAIGHFTVLSSLLILFHF